MLQIGDTVVYFPRGVFKVDGILNDANTGEKSYRLSPVFGDGCTVCIPESSPVIKTKIKKTVTREEAEKLIEEVLKSDKKWIDDEKERTEYFRKVLLSGDRRELLCAIRTVYRKRCEMKQKKRKLHSADEKFFNEADALIRDEFAYALNIKPECVTEYIASKE